jgi:hypothetical protein
LVAKAAPNNGVQTTAVTLRFTPAPDAWPFGVFEGTDE